MLIVIFKEEPEALAQDLLVPRYTEVSRHRGTSQCHLLSSCFNQVSWRLDDSRIHQAYEGRRQGLGKEYRRQPVVPWIQALPGLEKRCPASPKTPAPRRQRATQQRSLEPMAEQVYLLRVLITLKAEVLSLPSLIGG